MRGRKLKRFYYCNRIAFETLNHYGFERKTCSKDFWNCIYPCSFAVQILIVFRLELVFVLFFFTLSTKQNNYRLLTIARLSIVLA